MTKEEGRALILAAAEKILKEERRDAAVDELLSAAKFAVEVMEMDPRRFSVRHTTRKLASAIAGVEAVDAKP